MRKFITGIAAAISLGVPLGALVGALVPGTGLLGPMPLAAAIFAGAFFGGMGLVVGLALAAYDATFKSDGIIHLMLVVALTTFVLNLVMMGNRIENFYDVLCFLVLGVLYAAAYKGGTALSARPAKST